MNGKLTILAYTFPTALDKRCVPQLASHVPHLNNKHTKQLWFPLPHTYVSFADPFFHTSLKLTK